MKKKLLSLVIALIFAMNLATPVLADEIASTSEQTEVQLTDPGILPGSPVYFADKLIEKIVIIFTFSPEKKAENLLEDANERLAEANALAEAGEQDLADKTAQDYIDTLEAAQVQITIAINDGKVDGTVYNDVYTVVGDKKSANVVAVVYGMDISQRNAAVVLVRVLAKSPEQARKGLLNAFENQIRHMIEENATVMVQIGGQTVTLTVYADKKDEKVKSKASRENSSADTPKENGKVKDSDLEKGKDNSKRQNESQKSDQKPKDNNGKSNGQNGSRE